MTDSRYRTTKLVSGTGLLLYLLGFFIPFAVSGPHVTGSIYVTPGLIIGVIASIFLLINRDIGRRLLFLFLMICIFSIITLIRHPVSSFLISISALTLILLILTIPVRKIKAVSNLFNGFFTSLMIILALLFLEILSQVFGFNQVYLFLRSLFTGAEHIASGHNYMLFYFRPYVSFAEPAHLAYYLAFSYAIIDQIQNEKYYWLKLVTLAGLILLGSLAGYVLILVYVLAKFIIDNNSIFFFTGLKIDRKKILKLLALLVFVGIALPVAWAHSEFANFILSRFTSRVAQITGALFDANVSSSAGVRSGAYIVLIDYWRTSGLLGVLIGTGYANYSEWMIQYYGGSQYTTFSTGRLHSYGIVIILSTGLVGLAFYMTFLYSVFRYFGQQKNIAVIVLVVVAHFASGSLLDFTKWQLLFVLLSTFLLNARMQYDAK